MPETVPHVAGLILARGGSQGIPLKNVVLLGSRPLLAWSLGAMTTYGGFDSIWVSTDHPGIAACATSLGANVFPRSPQFASAQAPSVEAVKEFLAHRPEVDIVALVQCTSPFLRPEFLSKAHRLMVDHDYDAVFSVCRQKKFRWSETLSTATDSTAFRSDESKCNNTRPLNCDPSRRPRRQDWRGDIVENGMFYFAKRHLVQDQGLLQGGKKCSYVEVPSKLSIEIDSSLDLAMAEQLVLHEGLEAFVL